MIHSLLPLNDGNWFENAQKRISVRQYSGAPDEAQFEALTQFAQKISGNGVRAVVRRGDVFTRVITGTDTYAALIASKDAMKERAGYAGEALALQCISWGLGSCFLGVSMKKSAVRRDVLLRSEETLLCILSIGTPAIPQTGKRSIHKTLEKLTSLDSGALELLPRWQREAFACARLAPSALGRQPYEFRAGKDALSLDKKGGNFGYGDIDAGIAMLHLELGAAHCGKRGGWVRTPFAWIFGILEDFPGDDT